MAENDFTLDSAAVELSDRLLLMAVSGLQADNLPVSRAMVVQFLETMQATRIPLDDPAAEQLASRTMKSTIWDVREGSRDERIAEINNP